MAITWCQEPREHASILWRLLLAPVHARVAGGPCPRHLAGGRVGSCSSREDALDTQVEQELGRAQPRQVPTAVSAARSTILFFLPPQLGTRRRCAAHTLSVFQAAADALTARAWCAR